MALGRTSNPTLNDKTFSQFAGIASENTMTLQGTINKVFILLLLVLAGAALTWGAVFQMIDGLPVSIPVVPLMFAGAIGGFIMAMVTVFKKEWSAVTAPIYAILEGLLLGALSAFFESMYPGIVIQAVALTLGTLIALLFAYKSGLIKATENFKLGVVAATGAIALVYFVSWILGMFGVPIGFIHSSGPIGIIFSLIVVVIAALNLVLDFDFIEQGAESGAPKFMEWYAAFGLMVTLIWLYIEILKLLAKMRRK